VGYGGSCFPKDVKALISISDGYGYDFGLLKQVERINEDAMQDIVEKAKKILGTSIKDSTIAVLGLSFKPNTDDMRDAPSVEIINGLKKTGATIKAFDPIAVSNAKRILDGITFAEDSYDAVRTYPAMAEVLYRLQQCRRNKQNVPGK
jgi:UDPglucose 6-dehydrogenase